MCHHRSHHPTVRAARGPGADDLRSRPDLRASDAERDAVVMRLREHGAAGRLDLAELEDRIGMAYAARTRGELARLFDDLPALAPAAPAPGPRRRPHRGVADELQVFAGINLLLVAIWVLSGAGYF